MPITCNKQYARLSAYKTILEIRAANTYIDAQVRRPTRYQYIVSKSCTHLYGLSSITSIPCLSRALHSFGAVMFELSNISKYTWPHCISLSKIKS